MSNTVHDVVVTALKNAGCLADGHAVQRTILVSNGYYVGQKFRYEGGYAVWLADANEIKVHDGEGKPLRRICLDTTDAEKAA